MSTIDKEQKNYQIRHVGFSRGVQSLYLQTN